jgi:hypothetical protein
MTGKEGQVVEGHEIWKATGRYLTGLAGDRKRGKWTGKYNRRGG